MIEFIQDFATYFNVTYHTAGIICFCGPLVLGMFIGLGIATDAYIEDPRKK